MSKTILELRQMLSQTSAVWRKGSQIAPPKRKARWPTGWDQMDYLLEGGLPHGGLVELIAPTKDGGGASIIRALLQQCHQTGHRMALIDGQDSFDPASHHNSYLARLLWVRCRTADEALKAGDLLLRDANVPLILLDLALNPPAQLRKIAPRTWYRFQRIIEKSTATLLAITPSAMVPSAAARLSVRKKFGIDALAQTEKEVLDRIEIDLSRGDNHPADSEDPI